MPLAQPGPPCVSPACWQVGLDELPARVAGRFARVEPRRHARAFVLALRRRRMWATKSSKSAWVACSRRLPRPSRKASANLALSR
jgi:hypothetical protein